MSAEKIKLTHVWGKLEKYGEKKENEMEKCKMMWGKICVEKIKRRDEVLKIY